MKLKITLEEKVWKEVTIDTDDFNLNSHTPNRMVFEIAELINEIKDDPEETLEQFKNEVVENREVLKTTVEPIED